MKLLFISAGLLQILLIVFALGTCKLLESRQTIETLSEEKNTNANSNVDSSDIMVANYDIKKAVKKSNLPDVPIVENGIRNRKGLRGIIVPGKRVGPIKLGDGKDRAIAILGTPTNVWHSKKCGIEAVQWEDYDYPASTRMVSNITIRLRAGKIFMISSNTPRFSYLNKIRILDKPKKLRLRIPSLQSYELMKSANDNNGNVNKIFWLNESIGVAFGIIYSQSMEERRIQEIFIFQGKTVFHPNGCSELLSPQYLERRTQWFID